MKQFKSMILSGGMVCSLVLVVPTVLVSCFQSNQSPVEKTEAKIVGQSSIPHSYQQVIQTKQISKTKQSTPQQTKETYTVPFDRTIEVAVTRSTQKRTDKISLEDYVVGVVASEMPAKFQLEALKAQALAARTYIVKFMVHNHRNKVTDTVSNQVYHNRVELQKLWGKDYQWKIKKIEQAVMETEGKILTYNHEPITASFFSTSNGYTEDAQDVWNQPLPYLQSVTSPWDKGVKGFQQSVTIPVQELERKLGVKVNKNGTVGTILSYTDGKKVKNVQFGKKILTGVNVRMKLGLRSADFRWEQKGNHILITTKGYGHGVGMSQYGANGMAEQGKKYDEIVTYYYKGVNITSLTNFKEKMISFQMK